MAVLTRSIGDLLEYQNGIIGLLLVVETPFHRFLVVSTQFSDDSSDDLVCALAPDEDTGEEDEPIIDADKSRFQAQANIEPQNHE